MAGNTLVELKKTGSTTTPTYLHPDILGSPRRATDASKAQLWREHYDPYGLKLNGIEEKIGYTGHAYDAETGLTYMQARFYDPLVGRFLSTDPVGFDAGNPYGFNRYAYANNNPYKYTDPNGQWVDTVLDIGFIAADVADIKQNGLGWTSGLALGADVIGAALPGATGLGLGVRAIDKGADVARAAERAGDTASGGVNVSRSASPEALGLNKQLASEQQMGELASGQGVPMAGAGTDTTFRDAGRMAETYGGQASDYAKVKSSTYTAADGRQLSTHAVQNVQTGEIIEPKSIINEFEKK